MPILYGLFVGIDQYQFITNPLGECVEDVTRFENCLRDYFPDLVTDNSTKKLLNQEATKTAIVQQFEKTLIGDHIKPGDTVLFYFSGHGGEEKASPVFSQEDSRQKLQNLACYDSQIDESKNFLADKELRFLIQKAAKPEVEVVTIFDCCHSGDNTRSIIKDPLVRPRLCGIIPQRGWEEFIFAKEHNKAETGLTEPQFTKPGSLDELLPEGYHIQLAACDSHESAKEIDGRGGIFTTALINTIKAFKGNLNYYVLNSHIRSFISESHRQNPRMYINAGHSRTTAYDPIYGQTHYKQFLTSKIGDRPVTTFVRFDPKLGEVGEWVLDAGGVYGIKKNWKGALQRIPVEDALGLVGYAQVKEVLPEKSLLTFEPYADVVKTETYKAKAPSLLAIELKIYLKGDAAKQQVLKAKVREAEGLQWVGKEAEADFCVLAQNEMWAIIQPNHTQPLAARRKGFTTEAAGQIIKDLKHIAKWWFVKSLQNEETNMKEEALSVSLTQQGASIYPEENAFSISLSGNPPKATVEFKITNHSGEPLFLSVLYLSSIFEVMALNEVAKYDHKAWWKTSLDLELESYVRDFGLSEEIFYLMVIASTDLFEVFLLEQDGLEVPEQMEDEVFRGIERSRQTKDWRTFLYPIRLLNPEHRTNNP